MLRAIILEDEQDSAKLLAGFLKDHCPKINLIAVVDTVHSAFEAINLLQPEVVFMDIELKGETCFDLLAKLGDIRFDIIFTTAHEAHALKAFKLSAIDYLLKPINVQDLLAAVEKVEQKRSQAEFNKSIQVLLGNLKNTNSQEIKIGISSSDGLEFRKVSNIIYLQSEGAYTYFFLKPNEKILTSKNIKEYEDMLEDHGFYRIHKSYIANKSEIVKYVNGEGGYVIMSNNTMLPVSRRRKEEFLAGFQKA